jgi:hypothetical protein
MKWRISPFVECIKYVSDETKSSLPDFLFWFLMIFLVGILTGVSTNV